MVSGEVLLLFSLLLEYPAPGLERGARRCEALLRVHRPEAAGLLTEFAVHAAERGTEGLEEDYAAVFDLGSSCPLYVGYHLFGESYKRSAFLLGLRERYRARGFEVPGELSDHLPVMLRFLSTCRDEDLSRELVEEAIVPSLDRMLTKGGGGGPTPGPIQTPGLPDCAAFCGLAAPADSAPPPMAPMVEADDSPAGEPKERSAAQEAYIGVLKALRLALQSESPGGASGGGEVAARVHG